MNTASLEDLRTKILGDIVPLAVATSEGADSFGILLRLIQSGQGTADLYQKAYESATSIEDEDVRLSALMDLLDEIELSIELPLDEQVGSEGAETLGFSPQNQSEMNDTAGDQQQGAQHSEHTQYEQHEARD